MQMRQPLIMTNLLDNINNIVLYLLKISISLNYYYYLLISKFFYNYKLFN